jgi:tRNA(fMet)-specific endonuclease VapC
VSVITEGELRTGAAKSSSPARTLTLVENFLSPITLLEFTSDDAIAYASLRSKLERAGTPIGALDTLIASQTIARKLTLVSNHEREFRRVAGLTVQNWSRWRLRTSPHDRARGLTVAARRWGHRSRGRSAPDSTHDQPEAPHLSQLHRFRSKTRGGGATSKWPSERVILPAPACLGTSTVSAAPSPLGQSGHGHGNCRCSWRCSAHSFIPLVIPAIPSGADNDSLRTP